MKQRIAIGILVVGMFVVVVLTACSSTTSPGTVTFDPQREHGSIRLEIHDGLLTARADGDAIVVVRPAMATSTGEPTPYAMGDHD